MKQLKDQDLEHLKGSDLYTVDQQTYVLVKSYRLKLTGASTTAGVRSEIKDLKERGYEVQMAMDQEADETYLQVTKDIELDMNALVEMIGDES